VILTIAARELRGLFLSPLAWSILAVVQLILAWEFLSGLDEFMLRQPSLAGKQGAPGLTLAVVSSHLFPRAAVVLLLVTPLLTMRLVSEERRNRTLTLLLSAPVSMTDIILGKYLGLMAFLGVVLGLVVLMPLSLLLVGGSLDFGLLASGTLGLALIIASFASAGLFLSTLTEQPTVAAVSTLGLLLFLWILDWTGGRDVQEASAILGYLSLPSHYIALLRGVFDTKDVAYYLLLTMTFLVMSIRRLDADRLQ